MVPPDLESNMKTWDAVVVGSGPNGLAAAIVLAQRGLSVQVREANSTIGGGARSAELTLPGFVHDICSAVHPLGLGSPFFQALPLAEHGLEWIHPMAPLAHPLDGEPACLLHRSIEDTAATIAPDGSAYESLVGPLARSWRELSGEILAPLHFPRHPLKMARFGMAGLRSASAVANQRFRGPRAKALFAGLAAHSILPMTQSASAAIGLVLAMAGHAVGWPIPRGGAQRISDSLAAYFRSLGGEITTDTPVRSAKDLPPARIVLFDVTPRQLLRIAADELPIGYRRKLQSFRYGPGIFKLDWALSGVIRWSAPECQQAATVHVGGTLEEIAASETAAWEGRHAEKPFVLLAQASLFDPSRAPAGSHTAWAYCHVPHGSTKDMTQAIENQVERFAPGFRDLIIGRSAMTSRDVERHNSNNIGGDIGGGANVLGQLLARPVLSLNPYRIPRQGWYLCSSSTPPGGGVHGMCGYHAAQAALRDVLAIGDPES
jgi:phytoene dehydrogenase-like protein